MSIQAELTRITNAKAAIKTAIEGKGVTVPEATLLDGMAALIESIEAGGGLPSGILQIEYGTYTPSKTDSASSFDIYASFIPDVSILIATDEAIFTDASGTFSYSLYLSGIRCNFPYDIGDYKVGNVFIGRPASSATLSGGSQFLTLDKSSDVVPYAPTRYLIAGYTYKWVALKFA